VDGVRRAFAFELLERSLRPEEARPVLRCLEDYLAPAPQPGPAAWDALSALEERGADGATAWTRASALYAMGLERAARYEPLVRRATVDEEPLVRETADWALARLVSSQREDPSLADR
jgi:hypothetical protein